MANQRFGQSSENPTRFFYGYVVVGASFFIMVVMVGAVNAYGVFFKPMLTEFNWSRGMTSGAVSVYHIVRGVLGIAMGGLTDRFGPRTVLTLCGIVVGLGYLLLSQINAIWQLYLFYGLIVGGGLSGTYSPLVSTVARWFASRRSMMTGIMVAGAGVGTMIIPPIVSLFIATYGWRVSYIILGGMISVIVVIATQFLKRDPAQMGQVAYEKGIREESRFTAGSGASSLRQAVSSSQLWIVCGISLFLGFCSMLVLVHIVPHVTDIGISPVRAASVLAITGGVSIAGRVILGAAGDKIGNKQVFFICFVMITAAFIWLLKAADLWMLYLFAVVFGFAFGGSAVVRSPLLADIFGLTSHGMIFGIADFFWSVGGACGSFLAGYIFDVTGSYQIAFQLSVAAGILSLILTWMLPSNKTR